MKNQNEERKIAYEKQTVKQLLVIAKGFAIIGRHDMSKTELIAAIIASENACEVFSQRLNVNTNPATKNSVEEVEEVKEVVEEEKEAIINDDEDEKESKKEVMAEVVVNNNCYAQKVGAVSKRSQSDYINAVEVGMIVAFKTVSKAFSAKVEQIKRDNSGTVTELYCKSKNGVEYKVPRSAVIWVKTGNRWPKGIFEQLKNRSRNNSFYYDFNDDDDDEE